MTGVMNRISGVLGDDADILSIQVNDELHSDINGALDSLTDDNGGPLLLIRPPKENEGMDASISIYETLHDPRETKIGLGRFKFTRTNAHIHTHEIWYHKGQMQFFFRPQTRVDANQFRRQIRSNYKNVEIRESNQKFVPFDVGDYVSVAEIGLKRDFYFPIKSKHHNDDLFDLDPYGDITSDMVVEEDETSDGTLVEAKDCRLFVQTVFEAARDVWHKQRPYGVDVSSVARGMKEGEVVGNTIKGYEVGKASKIQRKSADILGGLQGEKAYYITMRIIGVSPYKEIAQRRCHTVAKDFETYYNSITQQGLRPIQLTEDEMRASLLSAAERTHHYGFRDRFMSNGKFLQPVKALGSMAHIPNEDVNTPVIDWAKQDTGPGSPASGTQLEEQERENQTGPESKIQPVHKTKHDVPNLSDTEPTAAKTDNRSEPQSMRTTSHTADSPTLDGFGSGNEDTEPNEIGEGDDSGDDSPDTDSSVPAFARKDDGNSQADVDVDDSEPSAWGSDGRR